MGKRIIFICSFLIDSKIFISFGAFILTYATQIQLSNDSKLHPYLLIVFFATLLEYNLNGPKISIFRKYELNYWLIISTVFIVSISFFAKLEILIVLIPISLVTLFYSLPLIPNIRFKFGLRDIPFLKIFIISIVWSFVTILLPAIYSQIKINNIELFRMIIERILFVFAITIPFDIRDLDSDRKSGLKTIPMLIHHKNSFLLSKSLMILFVISTLQHYLYYKNSFLVLAFTISGISTFIILSIKKLKYLKYYYYGILDGTIILQGILILFSSK